MLEPTLAIMDETDSGLDIDALQVVANGVNKLHRERGDMGVLLITHYQRLLNYIKPDYVHVMIRGPDREVWRPGAGGAAGGGGLRELAGGRGAGRVIAGERLRLRLRAGRRRNATRRDRSKPGAGRVQVRLQDGGPAHLPGGAGLSEEIVRQISAHKDEPEWMLEFRLKALEVYYRKPMPTWGADLTKLEEVLDSIYYYVRPQEKMERSWDDVPDNIKTTFERLGIPEAEQKVLAGVGAQYESEMVYHSLKKEWEDKGIIFESIEDGLRSIRSSSGSTSPRWCRWRTTSSPR
jgi:hypothetical protein